jgi:hypothetical protein
VDQAEGALWSGIWEYMAASHSKAAILAGARYFGTSARLRGPRFDSPTRTLDGVEALGGVRFHVPLVFVDYTW